MKTAEEIGRATLERLAAQTAANRAAGDALRAELRAVWQPGMTAKQVIARLSRCPLPSVRRVQEILRGLRAESSASRFDPTQTDTHAHFDYKTQRTGDGADPAGARARTR